MLWNIESFHFGWLFFLFFLIFKSVKENVQDIISAKMGAIHKLYIVWTKSRSLGPKAYLITSWRLGPEENSLQSTLSQLVVPVQSAIVCIFIINLHVFTGNLIIVMISQANVTMYNNCVISYSYIDKYNFYVWSCLSSDLQYRNMYDLTEHHETNCTIFCICKLLFSIMTSVYYKCISKDLCDRCITRDL